MCFRPPSVTKPIQCPKCGAWNLPKATVCKKCGYDGSEELESTAAEEE